MKNDDSNLILTDFEDKEQKLNKSNIITKSVDISGKYL